MNAKDTNINKTAKHSLVWYPGHRTLSDVLPLGSSVHFSEPLFPSLRDIIQFERNHRGGGLGAQ